VYGLQMLDCVALQMKSNPIVRGGSSLIVCNGPGRFKDLLAYVKGEISGHKMWVIGVIPNLYTRQGKLLRQPFDVTCSCSTVRLHHAYLIE